MSGSTANRSGSADAVTLAAERRRLVQEKTVKLTDLGYDGWFEEHSAALLQPGQSLARVMAVDRGAFLVRNKEAETYAELAGKFRFAVEAAGDLPCVGDWVCVQCHASAAPPSFIASSRERRFYAVSGPARQWIVK